MSIDGKRRGARIAGTGHYLPEKVLTNSDFEKMVDTSDEWIVTRSGIRERRIASKDQAASDLAYEASLMALEQAGTDPAHLDMIIVSTVTPDMPLPATGCILQDRLGAKRAAGFDLSAACSGFVYGLSVARSLIISGSMKKVLVVGVELLSKITDYEDRTTCVLFGDGAGAALVEESGPEEGILSTFMRCDGSMGELLYLPGGGSRFPPSREMIEKRQQYVKMRGNDLFKNAVRSMVDSARRALNDAGLKAADLDFLIPHQANIRIIEGVRKRLKLDMEQVVVNIDRVGNTSSASIPIALSELDKGGTLKRGDLVMMVAFGGGLTWGSVLMRY